MCFFLLKRNNHVLPNHWILYPNKTYYVFPCYPCSFDRPSGSCFLFNLEFFYYQFTMSTFEPFIIRKKCRYLVEFFYIFFYLYFARIYGPSEILLIYTSAAVAHDVRDITSRPTTVGAASSGPVAYNGHNVVTHGVMAIVSCATALGSGCLYNTEIQLKMS
jgi:hypothetical protein